MGREELQRQFEELEVKLERYATKTKELYDQGLVELAEQEHERWKAVSRDYVAVGNQIEDERHSAASVSEETVKAIQEWANRYRGCL